MQNKSLNEIKEPFVLSSYLCEAEAFSCFNSLFVEDEALESGLKPLFPATKVNCR